MKALVTGSSGFIGSHLAEALAGRGDEVTCLVRRTSNLQWLKGINARLVYGDCRDKNSLREAVRGMDWVFHLAAVVNDPAWETCLSVNSLGTRNLVEACLETNPGLKKFVFVSSISAAGPSPKGCSRKEEDENRPVSSYGRSKLMAEEIVLTYKTILPVTILRPPNVIGPRQKELFSAMKLIKKRIKPRMGTGEPRTSLCSVEDVVRAAILLAERDEACGKVYFVTDSKAYRWEDITDAIAENLGVHFFLLKVPYWMQHGIALGSEAICRISKKKPLVTHEQIAATRKYYWIYDGSKIQRELGFVPELDMRESIHRTVRWYRQQGLL